MRSVCILLFFVLAACGVAATDRPGEGVESQHRATADHPVKADLLADVSAIEPGKPFLVGVRLKMQLEWHVYWKNPGDSGLPVTLEPSGPAGFTFGAMQWPLPVEFNQPGDIAGYGYTGLVVFPIEVRPPADLSNGATIRIAVKAAWLACRDVCIPGGETLELSLPVADKAVVSNEALFAEWRQKLPFEKGYATAKSEGDLKAGELTVRLEWTEPVRSVQFFPVPEAALSVTNVRVEHRARVTTIRFDAKVLAGQKLLSGELESLVVATDPSGTRRGITVPVRLAG